MLLATGGDRFGPLITISVRKVAALEAPTRSYATRLPSTKTGSSLLDAVSGAVAAIRVAELPTIPYISMSPAASEPSEGTVLVAVTANLLPSSDSVGWE